MSDYIRSIFDAVNIVYYIFRYWVNQLQMH